MKLDRKEAVIFDLDGTLVDSMRMRKAIDMEYLARFNPTCPDDLQKGTEGMSFSEAAVYSKERSQLKETPNKIGSAWVQMSIEKYRKEVPLKSGVETFPEFTSRKGLVASIATSNGGAMMDAILDPLDIRRCSKVVVTACGVAAGKPVPDIYLNMMERLQVVPEDCVVSEDAPANIQAGKNAGVTAFAAKDAFSLEMKEKKEKLANYYIRDYYESLDGAAG